MQVYTTPMPKNKYRAQILLEPEQHQALADLAAERRESISHVVREIVEAYLVQHDREAKSRRFIEALEALREIREENLAKFGMIDPNFLEEMREERARELGV